MPNHITNRLTINGTKEDVKKVFKNIAGTDEDGFPMYIDFNKIKPMPESLGIESGSSTDIGMALYNIIQHSMNKAIVQSWTMRHIQKMLDEANLLFTDGGIKRLVDNTERGQKLYKLGEVAQNNLTQYGATSWYEWCNKEWGTKWNAYDQSRIDDNTIQFITAWAGVPDLLRELAIKHPEVELDYMFADEDWGNNADHYIFQGENVQASMALNGSPEAAAIAEELLGPCYFEDEMNDMEK